MTVVWGRLLRPLNSLTARLFVAGLLAFMLSPVLSEAARTFFWTVSTLFKDVLAASVPFLVLGYVGRALMRLGGRGAGLSVWVFVMGACASILTLWCVFVLAYLMRGTLAHGALCAPMSLDAGCNPLVPLYRLPGFLIVPIPYALVAALCAGMLALWTQSQRLGQLIEGVQTYAHIALTHILIPLLPVYVFGALLDPGQVQQVGSLIKSCASLLGVTYVFIGGVLLGGLMWGARRTQHTLAEVWGGAKDAAVVAFSTLSGMVALPLLVRSMTRFSKLARESELSVPILMNFHTLGNATLLVMMGLCVIYLEDGALPPLETFALFTGYYCLARLCSVCVPGGGLVVLLPFMQSYLGLSVQGASIVAVLYLVQEPFVTAINVLGNYVLGLLLLSSPRLRAGTQKVRYR